MLEQLRMDMRAYLSFMLSSKNKGPSVYVKCPPGFHINIHLTSCSHHASFQESKGSFNNDAIQQIARHSRWSMRLWLQFITPIGLDSRGVETALTATRFAHKSAVLDLWETQEIKPHNPSHQLYAWDFCHSLTSFCTVGLLIKTGIWWWGMIHVRVKLRSSDDQCNLHKEPPCSRNDGRQSD